MSKLQETLYSIYGAEDLGAHPYFTGDFINFGYWEGLDISRTITQEARTLASSNLYKKFFDSVQLNESDLPMATLKQGSAEQTGFENSSVTKVYSVEASHHFPSLPRFLNEAFRILKYHGQIGITTLFPTTDEALAQLPKQIPDLDLALHPMISVPRILQAFSESGFVAVYCESIGAHVFTENLGDPSPLPVLNLF
jgi:cyclopropane fatty-acyl-phospholipid synthase-like methyltransferase